MANIKKVHLGSTDYEVEALHFHANDNLDTPAQWKSYVDQMAELGFDIVKLDTLPPANASTYETYHNKIVLIPDSTAQAGSCIEYVILRSGSEGAYTYAWEQIGSTKITFPSETQLAGKHTHSVSASSSSTFTNISKVTSRTVGVARNQDVEVAADGTATAITGFGTHTTKNVLPSTTGIDAGATTAKLSISRKSGATLDPTSTGGFLRSLGTPTKKGLAKDNITGVSGSTTASKATAGTAITYGTADCDTAVTGIAKRAGSQTTVGNANVGSQIGAFVDTNGVLYFSFTALSSVPTAAAQYGASTSSTKIYGCGDTVSITPAKAAASTQKITPYTFADVTVPVADSGHSFVTGLGTGTDVITALGTPETGSAITAVGVSADAVYELASGSTGFEVVTEVEPTLTNATAVSVISALGTPTTSTVLTGVQVTAQPLFHTVQGDPEDDLTLVENITYTNNNVSVSGTAAEAGEHKHNIQ